MRLALEGIKVLDVAQVAAVPICARHLADFGADVIHIEHPVRGDSWRVYQAVPELPGRRAGVPSNINYVWENANRNKRSLTLDLSQKTGQEVLYKMVAQSDVLVTNFRPFELEQYKMEYSTLRKINPRLVYGSITAAGKLGAEKNSPGYDATAYWMRSGVPYILSKKGMPLPEYRPTIGDVVVGVILALGVMTALYYRERTGVGQEVDTSLFHSGIYQMAWDVAAYLATGVDVRDDLERRRPGLMGAERWEKYVKAREEAQAAVKRMDSFVREISSPLALQYETKDNRTLLLSMVQSDFYWSKFCQAIERPDMEHDPRFDSHENRMIMENRGLLVNILNEVFLTRTLEEWKIRLQGIPFAPIQNLKEVVSDPQAAANNYFIPVDHPVYGKLKVIANPLNFGETPVTYRKPAPAFNQHTEEVLLEYGYSWDDIAQLKEKHIIA